MGPRAGSDDGRHSFGICCPEDVAVACRPLSGELTHAPAVSTCTDERVGGAVAALGGRQGLLSGQGSAALRGADHEAASCSCSLACGSCGAVPRPEAAREVHPKAGHYFCEPFVRQAPALVSTGCHVE